jgi:hypothetical protein
MLEVEIAVLARISVHKHEKAATKIPDGDIFTKNQMQYWIPKNDGVSSG